MPADHFYRHLEATLDLAFVRGVDAGPLRRAGPAQHRPGGLLQAAAHHVLRRDPLRAQADRDGQPHLAHRWYLGYALDEPLPDHSSLTRIRQRLGVDIFRRFFEQIVELCQEAGLVWGQELYFDATKVGANAA